MKADIERNEKIAQLQKAYAWAVSQKENYENRVELAKEASCRFNVTLVPQTLCKLIQEGRSQILLSGPKRKMPKDHMDAISLALNTWLTIGQINSDPEKKTDDILRVLDQVLKNKKIVKSWTIYQHYKKENAYLLQLPKDAPLEQLVKEIVRGGISLSSLFYTVGPQCLSADEIFIAYEYRERLKLYEAEKRREQSSSRKKNSKMKQRLCWPFRRRHI
jgi:hypothetical protein